MNPAFSKQDLIEMEIKDILSPKVLAAEKDYLIVYKPPRMHSAPMAGSGGGDILRHCVQAFPEIAKLPGRKEGEGGLLHRLDYETHGLMLIARTPPGMKSLLDQQAKIEMAKEYSALSSKKEVNLPGFPLERPRLNHDKLIDGTQNISATGLRSAATMRSAFRPYGPGRKEVRPVVLALPENRGHSAARIYTTEITEHRELSPDMELFRLKIFAGFRHQIRCHLAWIGHPILNDRLYGGTPWGNGLLALRACSLSFRDPSSGQNRRYSIPALSLDEV